MSNELIFKAKVILKGKIKIETGLAIGGNPVALDIGGMDSPVIKDADGVPYIPGSSIKGKMRSLLEKAKYPLRSNDEDDGLGYFDKKMIIHRFESNESNESKEYDDIMDIFGSIERKKPVRGIFRDAYLDIEHFEQNRTKIFKNLDLLYTEDKSENSINRITAEATPRHLERVPKGTLFDFEIIINMYQLEDKNLLDTLFMGFKLLMDDYLGGSGTRGSGKVSFKDIVISLRNKAYYELEQEEEIIANIDDLSIIEKDTWKKDVVNKISLQ
ncbi:MAG: type III-A CRISPR-associated RAMP protein Csm3 [Candidatus Lokiarchaeota archaeon]|nr:type III-A CRISPR-associated RAMP protein Csm3 [Candidatus Lokiarchaeota archaeon]